jgi:15-cis-phytoene synthase
MRDNEVEEVGAAVRTEARALDRDRYLAALLAPRPAQDGLMALAALAGELARVPVSVAEPAMGEIRLQWWRDALAAPAGEATGSPVADAYRTAALRHRLPGEEMEHMINAQEHLLEPGSLSAPGAIDGYAQAAHGSAFRLAAKIVGAPDDDRTQRLLYAAGISYGYVQLLRTLPALIARGRNPFGDADLQQTIPPLLRKARAKLAEARQLATSAPSSIRPAILPVALVEPYLAALESLGLRVASDRAEISPVARSWRLLKASVLGRL